MLCKQAMPVHWSPTSKLNKYLTTLNFADICALIERGVMYSANAVDQPDLAQRRLVPGKLKQLVEYIVSYHSLSRVYFSDICLNVQPGIEFDDGRIYLPYAECSIRILDGQHRCYAIVAAMHDPRIGSDVRQELGQIEVAVEAYSGLSLEEERQAFRDMNLYATPPGRSLCHGFDSSSPTVLIAKGVVDAVPQFSGYIEAVENNLSKRNRCLMTLSTLVKATEYMFGKEISEPLQDYVDWAAHFWSACARHIGQWEPQEFQARARIREESLSSQAVIFQALGMVARELVAQGLHQRMLEERLASLSEVDWRRSCPAWHYHGIVQPGRNGPQISNTHNTIQAAFRFLKQVVET
jgi:DGQHR domain-containing protein